MYPQNTPKGGLIGNRPAELVALLAIASAVYGWLVERAVPNGVAAIVGLVAGAAPLAVSQWRDGLREPGDPGDDDPEGPVPPSPLPHAENHELVHREGLDVG